jgi:hypothetical protein
MPMMRTAIKRKTRNQKQPLRPCRTTTTCGGGGVVLPIADSLGVRLSACVGGLLLRTCLSVAGLAYYLIVADPSSGLEGGFRSHD